MSTLSFNERAKAESDYIDNWLKSHHWTRNPTGNLPDLTKPDGTYQDIKVMTYGARGYYNLVVQKHGTNGTEVDDWADNGILDKCEFKFICPDKKIYIISCKDFMDNIDKQYARRLPTKEYSGTSFYLVEQGKLAWVLLETERYNDKIYTVFKLNKNLEVWM